MPVKIFLDSGNLQEVQSCVATGLVDGLTTNPSLLAAVSHGDKPLSHVVKALCQCVPGPVSVEVTESMAEDMVRQGQQFRSFGANVVVKVPMTPQGLLACRILQEQGIPVNVTLCFSVTQALLAAKAGAAYVSPFVGRLDDQGQSGALLLREIRGLFDTYPQFSTQILAASLRHVDHVLQAIRAGVDCVTIPVKLFHQLYVHALTDKGVAIFEKDWKKTKGF